MKNIGRIIGSIAVVFCQSACSEESYSSGKSVEPSGESVESSVTFLKDGSVLVRDSEGNTIEGIPEREFFSCPDTTKCKGVGVDKVLRFNQTVIGIEVQGSHYVLKKIGDKIYKIPLPH